jgi:hypothetical protein
MLAGAGAFSLDPFLALGSIVGLVLVSALSGVVLLVAFRFTSRPARIREAKRRIQAHLLAVRIFRDDLGVVFRAQATLFRALGAYTGNMLVPFLVVLLPFALLFAQLEARWSSRPLHEGEKAVVKAVIAEGPLQVWQLEGSPGVAVDSPPVRISSRREIAWRVRGLRPGTYRVSLVGPAGRVDKRVLVADQDVVAARRRSTPSFLSLFLAPAEDPIDPATGVRSIEVAYPLRTLSVLGWHAHWIVVFLVVSTLVALALRRTAGVEF